MDKVLVSKVGGILSTTLAFELLKDENLTIFAPSAENGRQFSNICGLLKNNCFNLIDEKINSQNLPTVDYIYWLDCCNLDNYFENKYEYSFNQLEKIKNILSYTKNSGSKLLVMLPFCDFDESNKDFFEYYNLIKLIVDLINNFKQTYKTDIQLVRISELYGINTVLNSNNFVAKMIFSALNNKDIIVYNRGLYLTYCEDIASAMIKIMNNISIDTIIDISTSSIYLDKSIAKLITNYTKSKSKIIVLNDKKIFPTYIPELTYLNDNNITLNTSLQSGLMKTIDYIKQIYFN